MTETLGGACYFVTFADNYSRYSRVYFMREESKFLKEFKEVEAEVIHDKGKRIKALRTNNGHSIVINESCQSGTFPEKHQLAEVIPLYKRVVLYPV